jgi:hypothetical protein
MALAMALTCLLTIHGIGFQQPPAGGVPGYADDLHERLRGALGNALGDDPNRERGPVYVHSTWPPQSHAIEPGLERLGRLLTDGGRWRTDAPADWQRLSGGEQGLAHVALVYSHLEEEGPDPAALVDVAALGLSSITHYATISGLVRLAVRDLGALIGHRGGGDRPPSSRPSLEVRTDVHPVQHHLLPGLLRRTPPADAPPRPTGLLGVLRQVEDDVAAYVARNELRERVRAFVRDALIRLVLRADVSRVVVNSHSNGTVVAFDVLAQLPPPLYDRTAALVTAGSPLRKYVDLLGWGADGGNLRTLRGPWLNFYDDHDPVADPLAPPATWRVGQPVPADAPGLFASYDPDTGELRAIPVHDVRVDNVDNVKDGGGLPAHDYWDNDEFCRPVAELLTSVSAPAPA